MLVLSRKLNESIVIDGNIRVTVVSVHGNQIRLGIQAPDSVPILREELRARAASRTNNPPLAPAGAVMPLSADVVGRGATRRNP
jgi:carbon storage regulator